VTKKKISKKTRNKFVGRCPGQGREGEGQSDHLATELGTLGKRKKPKNPRKEGPLQNTPAFLEPKKVCIGLAHWAGGQKTKNLRAVGTKRKTGGKNHRSPAGVGGGYEKTSLAAGIRPLRQKTFKHRCAISVGGCHSWSTQTRLQLTRAEVATN